MYCPQVLVVPLNYTLLKITILVVLTRAKKCLNFKILDTTMGESSGMPALGGFRGA